MILNIPHLDDILASPPTGDESSYNSRYYYFQLSNYRYYYIRLLNSSGAVLFYLPYGFGYSCSEDVFKHFRTSAKLELDIKYSFPDDSYYRICFSLSFHSHFSLALTYHPLKDRKGAVKFEHFDPLEAREFFRDILYFLEPFKKEKSSHREMVRKKMISGRDFSWKVSLEVTEKVYVRHLLGISGVKDTWTVEYWNYNHKSTRLTGNLVDTMHKHFSALLKDVETLR